MTERETRIQNNVNIDTRFTLLIKTHAKTILQMMQEQEPLNDYSEEDVCTLYCQDGPMPCQEPCSWLELSTKQKLIPIEFALEVIRKLEAENKMLRLANKSASDTYLTALKEASCKIMELEGRLTRAKELYKKFPNHGHEADL